MDLTQLLSGPLGESIIGSISGQLGLDNNTATSALKTAIPAILGGLNKNARTPEGAASLNSALESKHNGGLLDNLTDMLQNNAADVEKDGNGILGHIFGSKVDNVKAGVAQESGVSLDKAGTILSMVAPIVMGFLGKQKSESGTDVNGLGGLLTGLLGGSSASSGIMGMVTGMLDKDNDGNVVDDLLGMFGK